MHSKNKPLPLKQALFITTLLIFTTKASFLWAMDKVSLKTHPQTRLSIPNPAEISKLPRGKTYQVNHEAFTVQFFFNEKDIFGVILKREKNRSIHFRWCFFRSCEESQHDYRKVIAEAYSPPFENGFFSIPYPFYLPYSFQGIKFISPN